MSEGAVVARGKIRVDARRAVAKLREHLLVDLHMYTLELARSAAALGATRVDLAWDTDDVFVAWDGAPVAAEALARLLDHVLADGGPEARPLELLGLAVNAALGLAPKYVDVYSGAPRAVVRVRWGPELLASGAHPAAATRCEAPAILRYAGTCVHVRKRLGATEITRALVGDVPREVELLRAAAVDFVPTLRVQGKRTQRAASRPLLRVALDVAGVRRAWLEVRAPSARPATLELLERGVCLERLRWSPGWFPDAPFGGVGLPVRVVVDADELPTNASRSAVREGATLVEAVLHKSADAWREALAALIVLWKGGELGDDGSRTEVLDRERDQLEQALGAVACVVVGASRRGEQLCAEARAVLDLPLLRDGVGRERALSAIVAGSKELPLYLWRGAAALDEQLAPWMRDVLWVRGRVAENTLSGLCVRDAAEVVRLARTGAERRAKHLAHPAGEPSIPAAVDHVARERFRHDGGGFAGAHGEVAIVASPDAPLRGGSTVRIFVEGRALEAISLGSDVSSLPFEVALAWEGRLVPRFRYDGVERGLELSRALWLATRMAILAVDRLGARHASSKGGERRMLAALLRAAVVTHVQAAPALGLTASEGDLPLGALRGVYEAPVWPTTEAKRLVSLRDIAAYAQRTGAVCTAPAGTSGRAADGRPVIAADASELAVLGRALGGSAVEVPYARALAEAADDRFALESARLARLHAELTERGVEGAPRLVVRWPQGLAVIAADVEPRVVCVHAGVTLGVMPLSPALGPVSIAIDDDGTVPAPGWDGVKWSNRAPLWKAQRELCVALAAALAERAGAPRSTAAPPFEGMDRLPLRPWDAGPVVRTHLIASATALRRRGVGEVRADAPRRASQRIEQSNAAALSIIEALPIVAWLDERGQPVPASLRDASARHGGEVPIVSSVPGFETGSWQPLFAETLAERDALGRWFGARAKLADEELPQRARAAVQEQARRRLLAQPEQDPSAIGESADPTRAFRADGLLPSGICSLVVGLPSADGPRSICAAVEVLWERRVVATQLLTDLPLPVVARVGVDASMLEGWSVLSATGRDTVRAVVRTAALQLGVEVLRAGCGARSSNAFFGDLRVLDLCVALCRSTKAPELFAVLRSDRLLWPTVQCAEVPLATLRANGAVLSVGRRRYPSWRGPTRAPAELDHPIAYIPVGPNGSAVEALLEAMSMTVHDVTEHLDRLQARRAAAAPAEVPKLAGEPAHPALRASLADLGVQSAVGELELIGGEDSDVHISLESGVRVRLDGGTGAPPPRLPHRAVALIEGDVASPALLEAVALDIAVAAERLLVERIPRLDELPALVRHRLRALVCRRLAAEPWAELGALADAPVLPDVDGGFHAVSSLRASPGWPATTLDPPYPRRAYARPALRLTASEMSALRAVAEVLDVTDNMRADLRGEQRASALPLQKVELSPEVRGRCAYAFPFAEEGLSGEVGVLLPAQAGARGISVHLARRPLAAIPDGRGWPLRAACDAATVTPNRGFDGLAAATEADALRASVRRVAERGVRRAILVPDDALAVRWLGIGGEPPDAKLEVIGALWLPARWPRAPELTVRSPSDGSAQRSRPLILRTQLALMSGLVPVEGELLVRPAASVEPLDERGWGHLAAICFQAAASMVVAVAGDAGAREAIEPYRWNLRLLGNTSGGDPRAALAGGGTVAASEVLAELYRLRCLWFGAGGGSVDGQLPSGEMPAFVLADGSALLEVLRHRADPGVLRELGGAVAAPPASPAAVAPSVEVELDPARLRPVLVEGGLFDPDLAGGRGQASSWFEGIKRRVLALLPRRALDADAPPSRRGLRLALRDAVQRLALTGNPVAAVVYAERGRPVRYLQRKRTLVVNREHPAVRGASPGSPAWPLLVAAAVCEVNRGLSEVTDAEEVRALLELLRAPP